MSGTLETNLNNPSTPVEAQIAALGPWFHNLHLPDGSQTAPNHLLGDFPSFKWDQLKGCVPEDLSGWSVLDIGCNSGFYSFELARRGAQVRAIDVDPRYLAQAGWAARQYGLESKVTFEQLPLYELAREDQSYDLVWFMGVLYHLRYPLLALDIIRQKSRRMMVMQSLTSDDQELPQSAGGKAFDDIRRATSSQWPTMAFVERELMGDCTNWWVPSQGCLEAMLRSSGFKITGRPTTGTFICELAELEEKYRYDDELAAAAGLPGGAKKSL